MSTRPLPSPHLHMFTFSFVPTQLGKTDSCCVPQHGPTLIFVVKARGSVKHEGPSTSKRQIGEICQALYTGAFTPICHTYDGAMCSEPFCLHMVWRTALLFFFLFPVRLVAFANLLLDRSRLFGLALHPFRSCLSMPPGNLVTLEAPMTGASICDAPWLALKTVAYWNQHSSESVRQSRERFR